VWTREIDGRALTFHLAGINNQNFLMRDEETGSFWQQITGKAVSGPLAGRQLQLISTEELSFGLWRQENPRGTVLQPVAEFRKWYEPKDWDKRIGEYPSVVDTKKTGIAPRTLMIGVEMAGASKAYPLKRLLELKVVQDRIAGKAIVLIAGSDGKSIRAFQSEIDGVNGDVEFFAKADTPGLLMDSATGSEWDFKGCAVSGSAAGRCLKQVGTICDFWFDWHLYHPNTTVFRR
jgi:hypothetical protein